MAGGFPKVRSALPAEFAAIYTEQYQANRRGATPTTALSRRMERWLHRMVAADLASSPVPCATLEIGAGTLNQLDFEPRVGPYDIVEPFEALYLDSPHLVHVRDIYRDIAEVPEARRYDRITSVATFEHICDLPAVVARAGRLLRPAGTLRVAIPSEGTILWTLGWKLTTGIEFRLRHGLDYGVLMRYEHVNTAREIEAVLRSHFEQVRGRFCGLSRSWSFYQFFECRGFQDRGAAPGITEAHRPGQGAP